MADSESSEKKSSPDTQRIDKSDPAVEKDRNELASSASGEGGAESESPATVNEPSSDAGEGAGAADPDTNRDAETPAAESAPGRPESDIAPAEEPVKAGTAPSGKSESSVSEEDRPGTSGKEAEEEQGSAASATPADEPVKAGTAPSGSPATAEPSSETTSGSSAEESAESSSEKSPEPSGESVATSSESEEPSTEDVESYYRGIAEKAESLTDLTDWAYVTHEFANLENLWSEGPDPEGVDIKPFRSRIEQSLEHFEEKKRVHYEEQERIRNANLERKNELLAELQKIVEGGVWTASREVSRIQGQWDQLKPLPPGSAEALQETYDKLIAEFEEHKVERIVQKKQKEEENLAGKLMILDKMKEQLKTLESEEPDWGEAESELNRFNRQWRKVGRVPTEKNQEIWDQYHQIQDQFHQIRFKLDRSYRNQIEKFLAKKKQLIREAEALVDNEDLAEAARDVNKLHRQWKKVGNLPQKDENELWDQFKQATDAFNEKKSKNIDTLKEQEEQNLKEKQQLIRTAEEMNDSEEWEETHKRYQELMEQWKKVGPVPRKMSGKIWKKFKKAMDIFYDRRRDYFKEVKKRRKQNLEEKQEVLKKLNALTTHEDPVQAVEEAKPLQEEFKKAGYVPIKYKNRMWKEYREVCDTIYDRFRAVKSAAEVVGRENVADFSVNDLEEIQEKQKEADRLRKEVNRLHSDMIQMRESLSYFKPSGKGSSLLDEVHEKLERAEKKIEKREEELGDLERQIEQMKRDPS